MAGRGGGDGGSNTLKASLMAVLFVSFLWFLFVGILANNQAKKADIENMMKPPTDFIIWKMIRSKRHSLHHDSNFNFVSKRRVPNGPDPIHNRRAREYRLPPLWP